MTKNIKRNQKSEIEAENDISTVHELPFTEIVKSATIRLASGGILGFMTYKLQTVFTGYTLHTTQLTVYTHYTLHS